MDLVSFLDVRKSVFPAPFVDEAFFLPVYVSSICIKIQVAVDVSF